MVEQFCHQPFPAVVIGRETNSAEKKPMLDVDRRFVRPEGPKRSERFYFEHSGVCEELCVDAEIGILGLGIVREPFEEESLSVDIGSPSFGDQRTSFLGR